MTTHLVLGTGAVGAALANHLAEQGHTVRAVNRSGNRGALHPAIPLRQADLNDPGDAASALAGADVVYQVTQPAYTRWGAEFPALQRTILAAAERADASVVLADNLYGYGSPRGATITDDSPREATTRKGRVRIAMAAIGTSEHGWGRAWITPVMAPLTQADLIARLWEALGRRGTPKVSAVRGAAVRGLGIFMPMLRESVEMLYEFDEPFVVSSAECERTFGWAATSWDDAVAQLCGGVRV